MEKEEDIWSDKVQDNKAEKCRNYLVRGRIGGQRIVLPCTCYMLELVGKCNIARTENRHFQQKFDRMSTHYYATGLYLQSMNS